MVRIKSIPRKHPSYISNDHPLPHEIRRLIFEFAPTDVDTFFICLGRHVDKSPDVDSYFNTGCIRYKLVGRDGYTEFGKYNPAYGTDIRGIRPGVRVYKYAEDIRARALWNCYDKSVSGTRPGIIAQALDTASWSSAGEWDQSRRLYANTCRENEKDRAENQIVGTIQESNCKTHTFRLGLVNREIYPKTPEPYGQRSLCCPNYGKPWGGCSTGVGFQSFDERTYNLERQSRFEDTSSGPFSGFETDSEYESEYDGSTGEKIESIRLADYDDEDRLYVRQSSHITCFSPLLFEPRIANAHLKNSDGVTVLEPLSWRISINPRWRSTHTSRYVQPSGGCSLVIGRRHEFLSDVETPLGGLWESEYTCWDDFSRDTVDTGISLMQYYHMGIVPAYKPQPSYTDLAFNNPCCVVIPLMEIECFTHHGQQLGIAHYTLIGGLKVVAQLVEDIDFEDSIVENPDALYI